MPNLGTILPDIIESLESSVRNLKKIKVTLPVPLGGIRALELSAAQVAQEVAALLAGSDTPPKEGDPDSGQCRENT
jgi:hypothetical protein